MKDLKTGQKQIALINQKNEIDNFLNELKGGYEVILVNKSSESILGSFDTLTLTEEEQEKIISEIYKIKAEQIKELDAKFKALEVLAKKDN